MSFIELQTRIQRLVDSSIKTGKPIAVVDTSTFCREYRPTRQQLEWLRYRTWDYPVGFARGDEGFVNGGHMSAFKESDSYFKRVIAHEIGEASLPEIKDYPTMIELVEGLPRIEPHRTTQAIAAEFALDPRKLIDDFYALDRTKMRFEVFGHEPLESRQRRPHSGESTSRLLIPEESREVFVSPSVVRREVLQRVLDLAAEEGVLERRYSVRKDGIAFTVDSFFDEIERLLPARFGREVLSWNGPLNDFLRHQESERRIKEATLAQEARIKAEEKKLMEAKRQKGVEEHYRVIYGDHWRESLEYKRTREI